MKRIAIVLVVFLLAVAGAFAQTQTTAQISGTVTDPSGAVVPKAQITVTNQGTGLVRTTESNNSGYYSVPLLDPGAYVITVQAQGFQTVSRDGVAVAVGHSALIDFKLQVGTFEQKVSVSAAAPLIEPSNPNTTTTLNATQLADIPNPGNDLSYVANLAPGAVMNTVSSLIGGAGNTEFNGLPAVANNFSVDGLDANNPYQNKNATGASGLQLGLNAIEEVSINTASYSVDQGRQEAAQVNYVTKSGTNIFHGNAYEIWNGSAMNARTFFNNLKGITKKPRSNINEFGASGGGPIVKNKLFFFVDVEGIRLVLPTTLTSTLPTPAFQTYVLQQLPLGGKDTVFGTQLPPEPAEVPSYQNMFKLMGDTSGGIPLAVLGCPFDVGGGSPARANDGNGCAATRTFSVTPPVSETLFTGKLDYILSPQDAFWFRFQVNNGSSITPDPVNSIFNTVSSAPIRSGAAGWTHVFSPRLVNQFNPGITYNNNLTDIADRSKAQAFPITYLSAGIFTTIGGSQAFLPSGTATTTWQLNDNLSWNHGKHTLKFGADMRRVLISSSPHIELTPFEIGFSLPEFTFGAAASTTQSFSNVARDRLALVNLDLFGMDTFRITNRLTATVGVRTAWNSNITSEHNSFSRLAGSFGTMLHDVNQPLNQAILVNQAHPWASTPLLQWQPRAALAYQIEANTVVRAGFGVFATTLESIALLGLSGNAPSNATFTGGVFNPAVGGIGMFPGVPNSSVDAVVAANQLFQAGFAGGTLSCASPLSSPATCLKPFNFNTFSGGKQEYPYSMQWSADIEHQFGTDFKLTIKYLGTRGLKMFYPQSTTNAFQTACQGCFAPLPFKVAPDPRFGQITSLNTGASSLYNALQTTVQKRMSHGLTLQVNYTYSHCLDDASNGSAQSFVLSGGVPVFSDLKRNRGNCDYDLRHSLNGSYIYQLPFRSSREWLNEVISGWHVSGTAFVRSGLPFTVVSRGASTFISNGNGTIYPNLIPGQNPYTTAAIPGVTQPGTIQWLNPNAFQSVIDTSARTCFPVTNAQNCQSGNAGRNEFRAPRFAWTDLDIGKRFKISERISFKLDVQFYNLFNHPNFFFPSGPLPGAAGIPGKPSTLTSFGNISQTVFPQTTLLGSNHGGNASGRMIAFRARIEF